LEYAILVERIPRVGFIQVLPELEDVAVEDRFE